MEAYRKEQRAAELKKQNRQKRQQKESRLEGLDPLRLHWRLTQLQQKYQNTGFKKVFIPHHEQKQIARLEQDLADLKRSKGISEEDWKGMLDQQKKRETRFKRFKLGLGEVTDYNSPPQGQQRESVFWDPVFNHRGVSPRGFPYLSKSVLRKRVDKEDRDDVEFSSDEEVVDIPLPSDVPQWKKEREEAKEEGDSAVKDGTRDQPRDRVTRAEAPKIEAKDVYESGPQVRNLAAEAARFVPRQVQLKQKRAAEAKSVADGKEVEEKAEVEESVRPSSHPMMEEVEEDNATSIHVERVSAQQENQAVSVDECGPETVKIDEPIETVSEEVLPTGDVEIEAQPQPPAVEDEPVPAAEPVTGHKLLIGNNLETAASESEEEDDDDDDDDALY
ncbi:Conserved hypothetical protein [Yarrowia lipolytica]|nr:Conserved hypothetical protein [Yarrowia lipolytica]